MEKISISSWLQKSDSCFGSNVVALSEYLGAHIGGDVDLFIYFFLVGGVEETAVS